MRTQAPHALPSPSAGLAAVLAGKEVTATVGGITERFKPDQIEALRDLLDRVGAWPLAGAARARLSPHRQRTVGYHDSVAADQQFAGADSNGGLELSLESAAIRQELLEMAAEDLRVRAELSADGSLFQGYHPRMRAVHDRHAGRLAQILAAQGWPSERQVGVDGAQAAWLIVQHAIGQPGFQRQALSTLSAAAARGGVPAWQAAMLEDRIRTFEGRPQRYGTQFDWDSAGQLSPLPIEDRAGLDERRKALGLRPLEEEIQSQRRARAQDGERPPADWEARQREMEAWFRHVGWRT